MLSATILTMVQPIGAMLYGSTTAIGAMVKPSVMPPNHRIFRPPDPVSGVVSVKMNSQTPIFKVNEGSFIGPMFNIGTHLGSSCEPEFMCDNSPSKDCVLRVRDILIHPISHGELQESIYNFLWDSEWRRYDASRCLTKSPPSSLGWQGRYNIVGPYT